MLWTDKILTKISFKYFNYANVDWPDEVIKLLKYTSMNNHIVKSENGN